VARPGLRRDHHEDHDHERRERDLRRRVADAVEQARAPMRSGMCEHEVADRDRRGRGDKHRACGHVFGELCVRIERRRRHVDRTFDRGVHHLGHEHECNGEQQYDQLDATHAERHGGSDHADRHDEVDPQIPLRAQDVDDPLERVVEAVEQRRRTPDRGR
jgi:hypothetical protein